MADEKSGEELRQEASEAKSAGNAKSERLEKAAEDADTAKKSNEDAHKE